MSSFASGVSSGSITEQECSVCAPSTAPAEMCDGSAEPRRRWGIPQTPHQRSAVPHWATAG